MNKTYINEFLSIGLSDYFNDGSYSFERHIVECLTDIYGVDEIKSVYDANDEDGFSKLIYKYGLSTTIYESFLRDTGKFEKFLKETSLYPGLKTDLLNNIESYIITMYLTKCLSISPSKENIIRFEDDLFNKFEVVKMHLDFSTDLKHTKNLWNKKKRILADDISLVEIKPRFLDEFTYARAGIDIRDVKKMDYRMVEELNRYVNSKMSVSDKKNNNINNSNSILFSGNGYVDLLLVTAIIVTEVLLLIAYMFLR